MLFEKSLKEFERGARLSRECQGALKNADQRMAKPAKIVGSKIQRGLPRHPYLVLAKSAIVQNTDAGAVPIAAGMGSRH